MNSIQNYVLESLFERNQITIVDTYIKEDALIFPLKLVYEGRPEDLDVEKIKGLFIENGYTFDIY